MPKRLPQIDWNEYRDRILAKLDLRSEFTTLGLKLTPGEPGDGGWLPCHAFDREDRTPSAAVNLKTGSYCDHGGDGKRLGFFDLAAATGKYATWQAARDHYAAIACIDMHGAPPPRSPAENLEFLPWTTGPAGTELKAGIWCLKKTGVTVDAIKAAGGRYAKYMGHYTAIALPIWGPGLLQAEPVGWVLYNTTGLALPVYHKEAAPTWVKIKTTSNSGPGLIGQHALQKIQAWKPSMPPLTIFKVEGPSDLLGLWAAIEEYNKAAKLHGKPIDEYLVLTNAGGARESTTFKTWMLSPFAGHNVVVIGDADRPGVEGADKWARAIARTAASVRVLPLPYEVAEKKGKDLRDFLNGT